MHNHFEVKKNMVKTMMAVTFSLAVIMSFFTGGSIIFDQNVLTNTSQNSGFLTLFVFILASFFYAIAAYKIKNKNFIGSNKFLFIGTIFFLMPAITMISSGFANSTVFIGSPAMKFVYDMTIIGFLTMVVQYAVYLMLERLTSEK